MALKPVKPTVPPAPSRANPGTDFSNKADTFAAFQSTFADYMDATAEFVDERADEALAAALGGTLPALTGQAGRYIRVNGSGTAVEFAQLSGFGADISGTITNLNTHAIGGVFYAASSATGLPQSEASIVNHLPADVSTRAVQEVYGLTTGQRWWRIETAGTWGAWNHVGVAPGTIADFAMRSAPSGWLKCNGAAVSRTTYAALFEAICPVIGNPTVTIASPGVLTINAHGLIDGDQVRLSTSGALPTGLNTTTTYFVVSAGLNTFQLSATLGGAAINTSGTQSGTHTLRFFPHGAGDGTTTFNLPERRGEFRRGWDDGRGVDPGRNLGSAQVQDIQSHSHTIGIRLFNTNVGGGATSTILSGGSITSDNTGGAETRPRNVSDLVCIKF